MTGLLKATNKKTKSTNPKLTQDDIVYGHIFDAILEQRLPPGTKLSEEALGEIFGVSRTIIRRACCDFRSSRLSAPAQTVARLWRPLPLMKRCKS